MLNKKDEPLKKKSQEQVARLLLRKESRAEKEAALELPPEIDSWLDKANATTSYLRVAIDRLTKENKRLRAQTKKTSKIANLD